MRYGLFLALLLCFASALADDKPGDSSAASKASKKLENTANRASGPVERGLNKAGKWVSHTGERTGKAVDNTANKASSWVKKKTE